MSDKPTVPPLIQHEFVTCSGQVRLCSPCARPGQCHVLVFYSRGPGDAPGNAWCDAPPERHAPSRTQEPKCSTCRLQVIGMPTPGYSHDEACPKAHHEPPNPPASAEALRIAFKTMPHDFGCNSTNCTCRSHTAVILMAREIDALVERELATLQAQFDWWHGSCERAWESRDNNAAMLKAAEKALAEAKARIAELEGR